jgi:hypothetical protein
MRALRFVAPLVASFAISALAWGGTASAAPTVTEVAAPAHQYCAVIVSKQIDPSTGASKVEGKACSSKSRDDAHNQAIAARRANPAVPAPDAIAVDTLLAEEYQDENYGGDLLYSFFGVEGPCDAAGYTVLNYLGVEYRTSSVKGYNSCNRATIYDESSNFQNFVLPAWTLGAFNDSVTRLHVFHG